MDAAGEHDNEYLRFLRGLRQPDDANIHAAISISMWPVPFAFMLCSSWCNMKCHSMTILMILFCSVYR